MIHKDSAVLDMFLDYYKLDKDKKEKKYYAEQFLENNIIFTENYLLEGGVTIVLAKNPEDYEKFLQQLNPSLFAMAYTVKKQLWKGMSERINASRLVVALDYPSERKKISMVKIKNELYYKPSRSNIVISIILHEFKNNRNKNPYILVVSDVV